jgi:uncharacterized protein YndB with AHSA1/START domain
MGQIQESMFIRAPIECVFPALTDPHRAAEWNPAVLGIEGMPSGAPAEGAQWIQNTMVGGRTMRLICRITRLDTPTFGVLEISGDQRGKITTQCARRDGGTEVMQTVEFVPPGGMFGQMASGFISNALRREMLRTMERQRATLETECGDAAAGHPSQ